MDSSLRLNAESGLALISFPLEFSYSTQGKHQYIVKK